MGQKLQTTTHSFNVELAKKVGIEKSILLGHLVFYLEAVKANNRESSIFEKDGIKYYWTYMTSKAFKEIYSYMEASSIARWLNELEEDGYLISSKSFNKYHYDKTKWYTTPGFAIQNTISQNEKDISQNEKDISQNEKPIPVSISSSISESFFYASSEKSEHRDETSNEKKNEDSKGSAVSQRQDTHSDTIPEPKATNHLERKIFLSDVELTELLKEKTSYSQILIDTLVSYSRVRFTMDSKWNTPDMWDIIIRKVNKALVEDKINEEDIITQIEDMMMGREKIFTLLKERKNSTIEETTTKKKEKSSAQKKEKKASEPKKEKAPKRDDNELMNVDQFVKLCNESTQSHVKIIGEWADTIKLNYTTYGQWRGFMMRQLRVAKRLVPYATNDKGEFDMSYIGRAYGTMLRDVEDSKRRGNGFKYTLETVEKYLDKMTQ